MHKAYVTMKDGTEYDGIQWGSNYEEGWITIICTDGYLKKLYFKDMESAIVENERISITEIGDFDILKDWKDWINKNS